MKKTLAAVAVLGAFAGSAMAANVELYGSVSTGLVFSHTDSVTLDGEKASSKNSATMESAWAGDSVFGLTGEEELGNGWKVGFALENEFESDTGAMAGADDNKLFDSMSYLWVGNDTVKFAAGNLGGALSSAGGDFDLVGDFDPLEAAYGNGGMGLFATKDAAFDNAVAVELTPVDGLTVSLQASLEDGSNEAVWSRRTHYYGVGAKYENGPLALTAVYEHVRPAHGETYTTSSATDTADEYKNMNFYTVGASWDFEVVKPSFVYQHADKISLASFAGGALFGDLAEGYNYIEDDEVAEADLTGKTDSFLLGASAPLGDGTLGVSAQYMQAKFENGAKFDDNTKGNAYVFGIAYSYELSKRTNLYAAGVYSHGSKAFKNVDTLNGYQVGFGLNHTF